MLEWLKRKFTKSEDDTESEKKRPRPEVEEFEEAQEVEEGEQEPFVEPDHEESKEEEGFEETVEGLDDGFAESSEMDEGGETSQAMDDAEEVSAERAPAEETTELESAQEVAEPESEAADGAQDALSREEEPEATRDLSQEAPLEKEEPDQEESDLDEASYESMESDPDKSETQTDDANSEADEPEAVGPNIVAAEEELEIDQSAHQAEETGADKLEEASEEDLNKVEEAETEKKGGWFSRLKAGLTKTRDDMNYKINDILGNYVKIDEDMIEDLEDLLISSDIGMETTMTLIDNLKESIREKQIQDPKEVKPLLAEEIRKILEEDGDRSELHIEPAPAIILVVGVNGVGKTTTIGKLAHRFKQEGKSVLIAAADTFRAAAIEQVETWGERSETPVISHKEGADPAAVVYDAIQAQNARKIDVLICDTAGRLHNKKNLMNELEKIHRIIEKESPNAQKESLLVLDATTGQNAILQAKSFDEVTHLSGIVLTKLDGTAKGGVVLPLTRELNIPIKLIGVGEGMEDLQVFSGKEFADALVSGE